MIDLEVWKEIKKRQISPCLPMRVNAKHSDWFNHCYIFHLVGNTYKLSDSYIIGLLRDKNDNLIIESTTDEMSEFLNNLIKEHDIWQESKDMSKLVPAAKQTNKGKNKI